MIADFFFCENQSYTTMEAKKTSDIKKNVGYHFGHSVFTRFLAIKRRYHLSYFFAKIWKKTISCAETRKTLNFRLTTFSIPSGFRADLHARLERLGLRMDGMEGISKVSFISLYFVIIYQIYKPTYICTQKLSPTFLWVSILHVKLAVVVKNFEITASRWLILFWV